VVAIKSEGRVHPLVDGPSQVRTHFYPPGLAPPDAPITQAETNQSTPPFQSASHPLLNPFPGEAICFFKEGGLLLLAGP